MERGALWAPGFAHAGAHTLCCLQCDAGEKCAVRKGARIGKLCDCPRGTSCNSFLLKCLWGVHPAPSLPTSTTPPRRPSSPALGCINHLSISSWGRRVSFPSVFKSKNTLDVTLWGIMPCMVLICVQKYSYFICLTNSCVSICKVGELCFETVFSYVAWQDVN